MLVVMDTQDAEAGQAHCHPGQEQTLSKIKENILSIDCFCC